MLITVLNSLYTGLEIYKQHLREEWTDQDTAGSETFSVLIRLGDWTTAIEVSIALLMLLVVIWMIKKQPASINTLTCINSAIVVVFTVLGYIISQSLDVPIGNAVQQLAGPVVITAGLLAYWGIATFINKKP